MASRIWEPLEDIASKFLRFGEIAITAHTHKGRVHKLTVDLGGSKLSWTLEDVEATKVELRLLE